MGGNQGEAKMSSPPVTSQEPAGSSGRAFEDGVGPPIGVGLGRGVAFAPQTLTVRPACVTGASWSTPSSQSGRRTGCPSAASWARARARSATFPARPREASTASAACGRPSRIARDQAGQPGVGADLEERPTPRPVHRLDLARRTRPAGRAARRAGRGPRRGRRGRGPRSCWRRRGSSRRPNGDRRERLAGTARARRRRTGCGRRPRRPAARVAIPRSARTTARPASISAAGPGEDRLPRARSCWRSTRSSRSLADDRLDLGRAARTRRASPRRRRAARSAISRPAALGQPRRAPRSSIRPAAQQGGQLAEAVPGRPRRAGRRSARGSRAGPG